MVFVRHTPKFHMNAYDYHNRFLSSLAPVIFLKKRYLYIFRRNFSINCFLI